MSGTAYVKAVICTASFHVIICVAPAAEWRLKWIGLKKQAGYAVAIFMIIKYIIYDKNKEVAKKSFWIDIVLWIVTVFELYYLESSFDLILWF